MAATDPDRVRVLVVTDWDVGFQLTVSPPPLPDVRPGESYVTEFIPQRPVAFYEVLVEGFTLIQISVGPRTSTATVEEHGPRRLYRLDETLTVGPGESARIQLCNNTDAPRKQKSATLVRDVTTDWPAHHPSVPEARRPEDAVSYLARYVWGADLGGATMAEAELAECRRLERRARGCEYGAALTKLLAHVDALTAEAAEIRRLLETNVFATPGAPLVAQAARMASRLSHDHEEKCSVVVAKLRIESEKVAALSAEQDAMAKVVEVAGKLRDDPDRPHHRPALHIELREAIDAYRLERAR